MDKSFDGFLKHVGFSPHRKLDVVTIIIDILGWLYLSYVKQVLEPYSLIFWLMLFICYFPIKGILWGLGRFAVTVVSYLFKDYLLYRQIRKLDKFERLIIYHFIFSNSKSIQLSSRDHGFDRLESLQEKKILEFDPVIPTGGLASLQQALDISSGIPPIKYAEVRINDSVFTLLTKKDNKNARKLGLIE